MNWKALLLTAAALSGLLAALNPACAQGTAFTYQGRLNEAGTPANGLFDLRAALFTSSSGGGAFAGPITNSAVVVSNGLFATTLDFGNVFDGTSFWLQLSARTNGTGGFTLLSPRQQLTPSPYSMFANIASNLSGAVSFSQLPPGILTNNAIGVSLSGLFSGNGTGLSNLDAATLSGLSSAGFWQLGGNSVGGGQFIGSTNPTPVEIWAGGQRALRLEQNVNKGAPNVIGGASANYVGSTAIGATIAGGGALNYVGSTYSNSVTGDFGSVGGGYNNTASALATTVGGGFSNSASAQYSMVGAGYGNSALRLFAFVGGGQNNTANGAAATVAGGQNNLATGTNSTVGGGGFNAATFCATASGGQSNSASGQYSVVAGGGNNIASGLNATVGGGTLNLASLDNTTVGGGYYNAATAEGATVAGGNVNAANGTSSAVGGGYNNTASGYAASIPGGYGNWAIGNYSFAAGNLAVAYHQGAFVWADSQNSYFESTGNDQFLIRAQGGVGINTSTPGSDSLSVGGTARMNNNDTYFRASGDVNHGLGWYGTGKPWPFTINGGYIPTYPDGPVLYGYGGGYLGTCRDGSNSVSLAWNSGRQVLIPSLGQTGPIGNNPLTVWLATCDGNNWVNYSDRKGKENFTPVNPREILAKVVEMPVLHWTYKNRPTEVHLGPVAQDFHEFFGLNGTNDTQISTIDESGVALSAIQGLNQKVEETDQRLQASSRELEEKTRALVAENAALKRKTDLLEKQVQAIERLLVKERDLSARTP